MSNLNAKSISVKGYLTPDVYLDMKSVFEPIGLSMSSAIGLGLQKLSASIRRSEPAHRTRRNVGSHMPRTVLRLPVRLPRSAPGRRGGPIAPMRV